MRLVTKPEGFMVEMEGVVVRAERGRELGNRLDCLAVQFRALARALAELPGRCVFLHSSAVGDTFCSLS